jgi:energy-converting hydrogenase Eha subunit A
MPLSNSATRRYTPPTCTLEVAAKNSPLSRWVGQSVLKDLRFELRFDDPRQSDDNRVTIRGDAESLEILCNSVNSYVQNLLDPSKAQLPLVENTPINATDKTQESSFDGNSSANLADQEINFSEDTLPKLRNPKPLSQSTEISLRANGLLYHELFLGRLANEESGEVVNLTVIQLFDLATALDEYVADIVALPNLNSTKRQKSSTPWGPIAAGAVLALGVTAGGVQLISQSGKNQVASKSVATPASSPASESLLSQVPPPPPTPIPITPIPTPSVPPSLASSPTLSPPGRVTIPTPEATKDEPIIKKPQTLAVNPAPLTIPVAPQRTIPALGPTKIQTLPNSSDTLNRGTSPSSSSSSSSSSSLKTTAGQSTPSNPISTAAKRQPLPVLPENLPTLKASPLASPTKLPDQVITETTPSVASSGTDLKPPESAIGAKPANTAENTAKTTGIAANSRLADSIPQVAEVRSYFQQRWKPPSGLTQTIEYSLSLNADGSIGRILPLGQAAGKYIDGTGIPLPGEPFVSPVEGSRNPTIRVVFTPDGKVDTFLEK